MKFCEVCDNMLYLEVQKDDAKGDELRMFCKNCNYSRIEDASQNSSICVSEKKFENDANSYKNYITPFIKFDKTIPHVNNIPCPNCKPADGVNEVAYVKFDFDNMRFLYFCCHCEHFWKNWKWK